VITGTSVGAIVGGAVFTELLYSNFPADSLYFSKQSRMWRKISDGNNGNAVVGREREWLLDLLSNKRPIPVLGRLLLVLEQLEDCVRRAEGFGTDLHNALSRMTDKAKEYPQDILKAQAALLRSAIDVGNTLNDHQLVNELRSIQDDLVSLFQITDPFKLAEKTNQLRLLLQNRLNMFQAKLSAVLRDLGGLRDAIGDVRPLVGTIQTAVAIWPVIAAHAPDAVRILESLGKASAEALSVLPELKQLNEQYLSFIHVLFDSMPGTGGLTDHLLKPDGIRELVSNMIKEVDPSADKTNPGNAVLGKWGEKRKQLSEDAPDFMVTASNVSAYSQLAFAVANADTLSSFSRCQMYAADMTKTSDETPPNQFILHPVNQDRDILLDAIFTSAAYPVAFSPQRWSFSQNVPASGVRTLSHVYVDGGICNNTPVDLAAMAGASHIISLELTPLMGYPTQPADHDDYNLFTILAPLLETSMSSALRNNISALVSDNAEEKRRIYRLAPVLRPVSGVEPEGPNPTPTLFDFGGKYAQSRSRPGHLLMSVYDWFMQGYMDCMGYPNLKAAVDAGDPVVQDYYGAAGSRGYRRNLIFGNCLWDTATSAWPDSLPALVQSGATLQFISLRARNFPNFYVRHSDFGLRLSDDMQSDLAKADASFAMVTGLADADGISFESVNYPGYYIRHSNFELRLDKYTDTTLYRDDATFYQRPGLAEPTMTSFESKNFAGRYIRHSSFKLRIDPDTGPGFKDDATFSLQPSLR
jgi:hypothetical protein